MLGRTERVAPIEWATLIAGGRAVLGEDPSSMTIKPADKEDQH